jgi:HEAT repeat protein
LEKENAFVQAQKKEYEQTGKTLSEAYVDYYGDLIASVAALKDKRALNALFGAINTGNMATRALAGFGTGALDQILGRLSYPDPNTRASAARALAQMLEPGNVKKVADAVSKGRIKQGLIKATRDADPYVRMTGVEGLATLGDHSLVPLIEKLAENDSFEGFGGERPYPVREAARKALEKLK